MEFEKYSSVIKSHPVDNFTEYNTDKVVEAQINYFLEIADMIKPKFVASYFLAHNKKVLFVETGAFYCKAVKNEYYGIGSSIVHRDFLNEKEQMNIIDFFEFDHKNKKVVMNPSKNHQNPLFLSKPIAILEKQKYKLDLVNGYCNYELPNMRV